MRLAPAALAVAVVVAGAAVELVGSGAAVEAVAAGAAVAAVLAGTHDADVVSAAPDAVAVAVAGDADVVAALTDAAVAAGATRKADVALGVADELVRAWAEIDDDRHRHLVGDANEVAVRTHLDFDRAGAAGAADGLAVAAGEVAAAGALVGHVALDDDQAAVVLHAQGQG